MLLSVEGIVQSAQQRTAIDGFDDLSFVEGLSIVVDEVNVAKSYDHPLFPAMMTQVEQWIDTRLRVEQYGRCHEEVFAQPIERPLLIVGAPRTGTTMLSYMLDRDPRWRSLLNWEPYDPVPPASAASLRTDPRCLARNAQLRTRLATYGTRVPVHWEWADGPTECNHVKAHDFRSQTVHVWVPTERYREFLYSDASPTYAYFTRVLQILQSAAPGRWALKSPSHGLMIDSAVAAFPDAQIVVTHRNPIDTVASMYSMKNGMFGVIPEDYSHGQRDLPAYTAEFVTRPVRARRLRPDLDVYDLYMKDLVRAPMDEMRRLYAWLGEELDPDVEEAMKAWLEDDSSRQAQRPRYTLADFGVEADQVLCLFEEYVSAHPRVMEP